MLSKAQSSNPVWLASQRGVAPLFAAQNPARSVSEIDPAQIESHRHGCSPAARMSQRIDCLKVVLEHVERAGALMLAYSVKLYDQAIVAEGERSERLAKEAMG